MDGCDSIYTMDLLVSQPDTTLFVSGDSLFVHDNPNSSYQWITCQDLEPIIGANEHVFLADSSGSYAVIVELYGCMDTSRCHSLIHSGMEKNPASPGMLIYPNPVSHNRLTVVLNSRSDDRGTLELFDLSGKMIWQDQPVKSWLTLDCRSYPEGVYFLKWTTGKQEFTRKVIISR
jgi:hypothetical protein